MTPRVMVYISPDHDLYHTSLFLSGLSALAARNAIALDYVIPAGEAAWLAADPVVICFDIHAGRTRRVAVDLRDGPGLSRPILDRVELYLKRGYFPPERDRLPHDVATRVVPFGLNFALRSGRSTVRLLAALGPSLAGRGLAGLRKIRQFLATPGARAFEQGPSVPLEPKVAFQTRLWAAAEVPPDEVEPLNAERLVMVRALKAAFGKRFVGGLMPTPLALSQFPGDVTPHPSKYSAYLAVKKRCLVSVYTRGVEHSLAFKLGETLAASQCLVSVPLRYELPAPLVASRHFLPFETAAECVEACQRLLKSPSLAVEMRRANHTYYLSEVEPAAHAAKVLARSLESTGG